MQNKQPTLFISSPINDIFDSRRRELLDEINSLTFDVIQRKEKDELLERLYSIYKIEKLELRQRVITQNTKIIEIDDRNNPNRHLRDKNKPYLIKKRVREFHIPFVGNAKLFHALPTTRTTNHPQADIENSSIRIEIIPNKEDTESIKTELNGIVDNIDRWIEWINLDIGKFNNGLINFINQHLSTKIDSETTFNKVTKDLGYPLERRDNAPNTYQLPPKRNSLHIDERISNKDKENIILEDEDYKTILEILQNMVMVIEKSPRAFKYLPEEYLRFHFLVQLNGQFKGMATGETFNYTGKTDINININGKCIFIAECKIWRGPKSLNKAISQLLNYLSWRDTKTAILVFNRNKNFSKLLAQIPKIVEKHPNYVAFINNVDETIFKYRFRQDQDPDHFITLTIMAFDIPR